jgi:hypothetical protein
MDQAPETLFRECAAGCRLQIFLERESLCFIAKCDIGLQPPRSVFRGMRHFARVVLCQSRAQVVSDTDVEMLGIVAFEDVDVFHGLQWPVFALRATSRQPSLASLRWAAAWPAEP